MKGFYCAIFVLLCLIWGNSTCKGSRHQLSDSHVAFNEVIRITNCSLHISTSYTCNICTTDFPAPKILATDFDCASFQCSMVYMFACRKGCQLPSLDDLFYFSFTTHFIHLAYQTFDHTGEPVPSYC